jgi:hypothetical protein
MLKSRIEKFNSTIKEGIDTSYQDFYLLRFTEPALKKEIDEIQEFYGMPIPKELLSLYQELGSIKNESDEMYSLEIAAISNLLKNLKQ